MEKIKGFLDSSVSSRVFPGCSLYVSSSGEKLFCLSSGYFDPISRKKVTDRTVYDLASLTKPLATSIAVLKAIELSLFSLDDHVSKFFDCFSGKNDLIIRELLCHISGLPAHRNYFKILNMLPKNERTQKLLQMISSEEKVESRVVRVLYSDIGYMILALLIEKTANCSFKSFVHEQVYKPLSISENELLFLPDKHEMGKFSEVVPTEEVSYRGGRICGEVHDDNAWAMGGVSGHAGLFGSASGVGRLLGKLLEERKSPAFFSTSSMDLFFKEKRNLRRTGAGLDMPDKEGSSSGAFFSPESVGHLGYTGTSFWIDPVKGVEIVFLSNRVWYGSENTKIKKFRPKLHNLVMDYLGES